MELINKILGLFQKSEKLFCDNELMDFYGDFKNEPNFELIQKFELEIGNELPKEISYFLSMFGGCSLLSNGVDISFFKFAELGQINREIEDYAGKFYPKFIIVANDFAGDYLVLYFKNSECYFGHLNQEYLSNANDWLSEAIVFVTFQDWLNMILANPKGNTIPNQEIKLHLN